VSELVRLIAVTNVKMKEKTFAAVNKTSTSSSSSYSENKLHKLMGSNTAADWWTYTQRHLARIYPAGTRVDSSNYDPSDGWSNGCQVVALNFQGTGMPMRINRAKFRGNAGTGYVLKPEYMLARKPSTPPPGTRWLKVTLLAGHGWEAFKAQDWWSPPDSYVSLHVTGDEADREELLSSTYQGTAYTGEKAEPFWNEKFCFEVRNPLVALLVVCVYDSDLDTDDHMGSYGFPLLEMREGWREVPLMDLRGLPVKGNPSLLCKFEWAEEKGARELRERSVEHQRKKHNH